MVGKMVGISLTTGINPLLKSILPEPKVFSKALYTIDIGQNDIASASGNGPKPPAILDQFYNSVQVNALIGLCVQDV